MAAIVFSLSIISPISAEIVGGIGSHTEVGDRGEKRLQKAAQLIRQGDIKSAHEVVSSFIHENKNSPHPDIVLAQLLIEAGRIKDAKQWLHGVTNECPNRLDVLIAFSQIAVNEGRWYDAYCIAKHGDQANASPYWDEVFTQSKRGELRLTTALCCEKRFAWQEARRIYETPGSYVQTRRLAGLGRVCFHLDDIPAAVKAYTELQTLDPKSPSPNLRLAQLCLERDNRPNTEKYFLSAIEEDKSDNRWTTQLAYARWLIWCNRADDAQALIDSIDSPNANQREITYQNAVVARMQRRLKEAQQILAKLHHEQPDSVETSNQYALVLIESDDEALRVRARQIAGMNARNHPQINKTWATLGWIQFRLGETKLAEESLMRSMKNGGVTADSAHYLSQVKQRLGQYEQARQLAMLSRKAKGPRFYESEIGEDEISKETVGDPQEELGDESDLKTMEKSDDEERGEPTEQTNKGSDDQATKEPKSNSNQANKDRPNDELAEELNAIIKQFFEEDDLEEKSPIAEN